MSAGEAIANGSLSSPGEHRKSIFGVAISDQTREAATQRLLATIRDGGFARVAFCNAHTANLAWSSADFRNVLSGFTVFADGIGVDIAARAIHGAAFSANLNGTDFVPALLKAEQKSLRIALYGAAPGVAERAAKRLSTETTQHDFAVVQHGFSSAEETTAFLDRLARDPVDILLVALGNPRQEEFIASRINASQTRLAIGVGALFDFLAGEVPRAPAWVRTIRLEWLYRLLQEPRRLFRRYVLGNPLFLFRVALVKLGLRRF